MDSDESEDYDDDLENEIQDAIKSGERECRSPGQLGEEKKEHTEVSKTYLPDTMGRYQETRLFLARVHQLENEAQPYVVMLDGSTNPEDIAMAEIAHGRMYMAFKIKGIVVPLRHYVHFSRSFTEKMAQAKLASVVIM
jgi:DNA-directed RNA polymerase subunit K/omega